MQDFDIHTPPFSLERPSFRFPVTKHTRLSNGILVHTVDDPAQPLVSMSLVFKRGGITEPVPGMAFFVSRMLTRGTSTHSALEIAEVMDLYGASLSSSSGFDSLDVSLICLTSVLEKVVPVFAECILSPAFSREETERQRVRSLAEHSRLGSDPDYLAALGLNRAMYGEHPYGRSRLGTQKSLHAILAEDCRTWYDNLLQTSERFLVLSGHIEGTGVLEMLENHFGRLPAPTVPNRQRVEVAIPESPSIVLIPRKESTQYQIVAGLPMPNNLQPEYPLLQIVNTALGGYFSSRLNLKLREELGYTYGCHTWIEERSQSTRLQVSTSVGTDHGAAPYLEMMSILEDLSVQPLTQEELDLAIQQILGSFARSIETPQQISSMREALEIDGLADDFYDEYFARVAAATTGEVFAAQSAHMSPSKVVTAICGTEELLRRDFQSMQNVRWIRPEEIL